MIKNIILKTVLFLILSFPVYSQVTEQWVKRFSQSEFSEESSKKILVDKFNGDIYVTGTTKGNITNSKNDITQMNNISNEEFVNELSFGGTEEVEILKEAIKIGREKKLIWRNPWPAAGDSQ